MSPLAFGSRIPTTLILKVNKSAAKSMNMDVIEVEGANTYDLFPEQAKALSRS